MKKVCIIIHVTKSFKLLLSLTTENIFCHNITFFFALYLVVIVTARAAFISMELFCENNNLTKKKKKKSILFVIDLQTRRVFYCPQCYKLYYLDYLSGIETDSIYINKFPNILYTLYQRFS